MVMPFCIWFIGWTKDPSSVGGFSMSPLYAPIWCRLDIVSAPPLCLVNLGIQTRRAKTKIINDNTPAIDIQTTFFLTEDFFVPPEFDADGEDGPSACFAGVFPEGGATEIGGDGNGIDGDVGGSNGATVELNGFPSFLRMMYQINKRNNHYSVVSVSLIISLTTLKTRTTCRYGLKKFQYERNLLCNYRS